MIIDNTHEIQRIFSKIIRESEGYVTDDNSNSSNVFEGSYLPSNYGEYSTRDEMIKILNGVKKITSPSWNPYPYTDDGKTYIYMSGGGSPFYPITNIEKKDNQIIFSVSEKDCIDWGKYEDNIEGKDKRDKDEERNSNNSSLMSNEQVLEQCKGIDEHTEFLASIQNKLYPIKRMDVVIFNKHDTIVLHANRMDIDEIRDKKHGLSKQKTRQTDQYSRKYKMSDGNTIIYVNPDDVYDAKKDGFHIVSEGDKKRLTTKINEMTDDEINAGAGMIRLLKTVKKTLPNYGRYYIEGGKLCINIGKVNSNITQKVNDIVRSFLRMCPKETTLRGKLIKLPEVQYAGESWLWNNQVIVMFAPIQTIKKEDAAREQNMQQADELDTSDIDSYSSDN